MTRKLKPASARLLPTIFHLDSFFLDRAWSSNLTSTNSRAIDLLTRMSGLYDRRLPQSQNRIRNGCSRNQSAPRSSSRSRHASYSSDEFASSVLACVSELKRLRRPH